MKNLSLFLMLLAFTFGFSQPTTNAPTPTQLPANVVSVFSDAYTNVATNYNPNWGQSGTVNPTFVPVSGSGNNVMTYASFNYQGTELTTQNIAAMEFLHVDVWTSTAGAVLKVSPINNGTGAGEFLVNVPLVNAGWSSVNLPKSAFTGMTWDSVFQLKFDGQAGTTPSTIYLDNIYFWKTAVTPATDATLSDLKVNGTTVAGFSPATATYNVNFPQGSAVPQITVATTTNASATRVITQASSLPGTATVLVTAQNGTTTKTYTVNYTVSGPSVAAPTPPARLATDVISLFSNAYTNIGVTEWSTSWDDSSISDLQVAGNDIKKITFGNFLGVQLANYTNASQMTHFHMDYFIDAGTNLTGKVINPKWSNHAAQSGETSAFLYNGLPTVTGSWVSIDVPISSFDTAPQIRNSLYQFLISSNLGTLYVDNIYFHKNTVLGTQDVNATKSIRIYPNPVTAGEMITADASVKNIEIFTVTGQKVKSSDSQTISSQGLSKGLYLIKTINAKGETQSSKIIVK